MKIGRPFALPSNTELRIFNFIIEIQELGFRMTVLQIRKLAYDLAEMMNRQDLLNPNKKMLVNGDGVSLKNATIYAFENLKTCLLIGQVWQIH